MVVVRGMEGRITAIRIQEGGYVMMGHTAPLVAVHTFHQSQKTPVQ